MSCDRNAGIPLPKKQGNGPSSQDQEEGELGFFMSCEGNLGVPLEFRRDVRERLELPQKGVKDTSVAQEGKVGFLSDATPEKVLSWCLGRISLFF